MGKTWFITGSSRGLGRVWTEAALSRGDRVVATARDVSTLDDLVTTYGDRVLALTLDITDREGCFATTRKGAEHFGGIDVLVNAAGYGLFGAVEEITEQQARDQMETNIYGALWTMQAILPVMREQGHGHVVQISSQCGVTAFPTLGLYCGSKWALEGITQALAAEVAGFGIRVTLVEPAGYATDWGGSSATVATPAPAYDGLHAAMADAMASIELGVPEATAAAMLAIVDAENPPLRAFLGRGPLDLVQGDYESRLAEWRAWDHVAVGAFGR